MNVSDMFASGAFLKKEHLQGQDVAVIIASLTQETVGDEGEQVWLLRFAGMQRPLKLCKTSAEQIAAIHGAETDHWIGKAITLFPDPTVQYKGAAVGGVRVRPVPPQTGVATPPVTQPVAAAAPPPAVSAQPAAGPVQF